MHRIASTEVEQSTYRVSKKIVALGKNYPQVGKKLFWNILEQSWRSLCCALFKDPAHEASAKC